MSSLMVSNLEIMMLEFAVQKLFVPKTSIFDSVIMKKTTVMFRMLDFGWTALNPYREDYAPYRGSNLEEENFHGGKSVVFALPSERLQEKVNGVDVEITVRKELSKYFEMDACQKVGTVLVSVDDLFNGIIRELQERKELEEYLSCFHKRQPISRSLKDTYEIVDEEHRSTGATITVYVRLSHFGKSVITEIELLGGKGRDFHAQEESNEGYPYRCKELKRSQLEAGCWGSRTALPPVKANQLICRCDSCSSITKLDDGSDDSEEETPPGTDGCEERGATLEELRASRDDERDGEKKVSKSRKGSKSSRGGNNKPRARNRKKRLTSVGKERERSSEVENGNKNKERDDVAEKESRVSKVSVSSPERQVKKDSSERNIDSDGIGKRTKKAAKVHTDDSRAGAEVPDEMAKPMREGASEDEKFRTSSKDQQTLDGSKARNTDAALNRRRQLRRRHHGGITVGLQDKEQKICCEPPASTSPMTCPIVLPTSAPIQPTICSNLCPLVHCCYPPISSCKATFSPRAWTGTQNPLHSCIDRPGVVFGREMPIYTN